MSKLTSRDFYRAEHKQFHAALQSCSPSGAVPFYTLFDDFLTVASCSIAQGVNKLLHNRLNDTIECEYLKTIGKYERERAEGFPQAMAHLVVGLETEIHDFLGDVYMAADIGNHWAGQYFTPFPVCEMMAQMTLHDCPQPGEKRMTMMEPCVGGGAMLLAATKALKARDFGPQNWWFEAFDLDRRCCQMAYIQLSLVGAPGHIAHGNSLSNEAWAHWITPTGALFPHFWPKAEPAATPVEKSVIKLGQMSFDLAA